MNEENVQASSYEEMNFDDLSEIVIPVSIKGKKYILVEADGDATAKYKNKMLSCSKFAEGKMTSVQGMADIEPYLLSLCMFVVRNDRRFPVAEGVVRSWPGKVIKKLYTKAREISELDAEETLESLTEKRAEIDKKIADLAAGTDAAGNEQESTEDGAD